MDIQKLPQDDAEAVLRIVEESGAFDELRQQLLAQIRANVSLEPPVSASAISSCVSANWPCV